MDEAFDAPNAVKMALITQHKINCTAVGSDSSEKYAEKIAGFFFLNIIEKTHFLNFQQKKKTFWIHFSPQKVVISQKDQNMQTENPQISKNWEIKQKVFWLKLMKLMQQA